MALLVLAACAGKQSPSYIVQVSLGPWQSADYSAAQIIARLDTVASIIQAGYGGKHHPREERDYRLDSPAGNLQGGGGVPARKGDRDVSLAAGVCGDSTQSFVGGVSGVLSCGCPLCRQEQGPVPAGP